MKKLLLTLMALVMTLSLSGGLAQTVTLAPEELTTAPDIALLQELKQSASSVRAAAFPETADKVSIKDGIYTITTRGVTITLELPFGWIGFTQDLKQQMVEYLQYFDDPRALVEALIASSINLLAIEAGSDAQLMVFSEVNGASSLFVDLADADMFEMALTMYQQSAGEGVDITGKAIGDMNFIRSLESGEGGEYVVYFTMKGGARIGFELLPHGTEVTEAEEELLVELIQAATLS